MAGGSPQQSFIGTVIGTAMQKTAKVRVERIKMHKLVLKPVRYHKNFLVHDEHSVAVPGDVVRINSTAKISKRKHFTLGEIVIPASRFQDPVTGKVYTQQQGLFKKSLYEDFRKHDSILQSKDTTFKDIYANPKVAERVALQKQAK